MQLVRHLTLLTLQDHFYFRAQHVPGVSNEIADALSRFQVARFRKLAPWANGLPEQIDIHKHFAALKILQKMFSDHYLAAATKNSFFF